MRKAMLAAAVCIVLSPLPAFAPPVTPCRLRLVGTFITAKTGHEMSVVVHLTVRGNDFSPPWFNVRMRCSSRPDNDCFLADGDFRIDLAEPTNGGFGGTTEVFTIRRRDSSEVCQFQARTGYFRRNGCFGSLGGTFECPPEGVVPVSGNFGWTVDTCKCLRPRESPNTNLRHNAGQGRRSG